MSSILINKTGESFTIGGLTEDQLRSLDQLLATTIMQHELFIEAGPHEVLRSSYPNLKDDEINAEIVNICKAVEHIKEISEALNNVASIKDKNSYTSEN